VYTIRRGTPADLEPVTALIAESFAGQPVSRWLVPPPDRRVAVLAASYAIHVENALAHGVVEIVGQYEGVAVWFPRLDPPAPPPAGYDERLAAACGPYTPRFRQLDAAFEAHYPHDEVHHHLAFLAAAPGGRDQGVGTALLRHHHEVLDEAGLPAYLEASNERARELYVREGYRADDPFHLPDGGPPVWPMWRKPG